MRSRIIFLLTTILFCQLPAIAKKPQKITLQTIRQQFPQQVAKLEAECQKDKGEILQMEAFQNEGETRRVSFSCWDKPKGKKNRSGSWLGILPLSRNDKTFVKPWTCSQGDKDCLNLLPKLKQIDAVKIKQAEFQCAMKNGTLFAQQQNKEADIRCGFFATSFDDENGDGVIDYEDPVGVDISVGIIKL
jgi:hypothetical protein